MTLQRVVMSGGRSYCTDVFHFFGDATVHESCRAVFKSLKRWLQVLVV